MNQKQCLICMVRNKNKIFWCLIITISVAIYDYDNNLTSFFFSLFRDGEA